MGLLRSIVTGVGLQSAIILRLPALMGFDGLVCNICVFR